MTDYKDESLDKKTLELIKYRILITESRNLKSKEYSDAKMADKIINIIKERIRQEEETVSADSFL